MAIQNCHFWFAVRSRDQEPSSKAHCSLTIVGWWLILGMAIEEGCIDNCTKFQPLAMQHCVAIIGRKSWILGDFSNLRGMPLLRIDGHTYIILYSISIPGIHCTSLVLTFQWLIKFNEIFDEGVVVVLPHPLLELYTTVHFFKLIRFSNHLGGRTKYSGETQYACVSPAITSD